MTAVRARLIEWGKEEDGGEEEWLEEVLGLVLFKIIPSSAFFSRMEMILKITFMNCFSSNPNVSYTKRNTISFKLKISPVDVSHRYRSEI